MRRHQRFHLLYAWLLLVLSMVVPRLASADPTRLNPTPAPVATTPVQVAPTPGQIVDQYGIPIGNQAKFQEFADRNNLVIDVRPTNPASVVWLQRGAVPKPQDIKAKTINESDLLLNPSLPKDSAGLVGLFKPVLPERSAVNLSDSEYAKLEARYKQRLGEWEKLSPVIGKGAQDGKFRVTDGRVEALTDKGEWKPITGDHDIFDIRRTDGSRLSPSEEESIIRQMRDGNMGVQHGPHMSWNPKTGSWEYENIYQPIIENHKPGGEPLVRFSPGQAPTLASSDTPVVPVNSPNGKDPHREGSANLTPAETEARNCFAAGTPIVTAEGERPIETIAEGDVVLSRDPETKITGFHRVTRTFVTPGHEVTDLDLEAEGMHEHFVVTPGHPFFVEGRGFTSVRDLVPGDRVATDHGSARVDHLASLPDPVTVFNFEVEADHTYFAGHTGAWVHNTCTPHKLEGKGPHLPKIPKAGLVGIAIGAAQSLGNTKHEYDRIRNDGGSKTSAALHAGGQILDGVTLGIGPAAKSEYDRSRNNGEGIPTALLHAGGQALDKLTVGIGPAAKSEYDRSRNNGGNMLIAGLHGAGQGLDLLTLGAGPAAKSEYDRSRNEGDNELVAGLHGAGQILDKATLGVGPKGKEEYSKSRNNGDNMVVAGGKAVVKSIGSLFGF